MLPLLTMLHGLHQHPNLCSWRKPVGRGAEDDVVLWIRLRSLPRCSKSILMEACKVSNIAKSCVRQLVKVLVWSNKPKASLFWVVRRCWWMLTPEKLFALPLPPSYRLVTAREGQGQGCSNSLKHSYSLQCSLLKSPFQAVLEPAAEMAELIPRSSHKNSLLLFAL